MPSTISCAVLLFSLLVLDMAGACHSFLPYAQYVGARAYLLQQKMECKGGKVYDIDNVQDIEQCKEACRQFDCDAVNLFQVGEFAFKCEILSYVTNLQPANGAACYYAQDALGGGFNGGFGYPGYGKKRK
uniref:Apple domain-containing protein n=1 Tax=Caenorhabditis tropicalis TaxID=1561998 RepID=A0A1I7U7F2_9PELO